MLGAASFMPPPVADDRHNAHRDRAAWIIRCWYGS